MQMVEFRWETKMSIKTRSWDLDAILTQIVLGERVLIEQTIKGKSRVREIGDLCVVGDYRPLGRVPLNVLYAQQEVTSSSFLQRIQTRSHSSVEFLGLFSDGYLKVVAVENEKGVLVVANITDGQACLSAIQDLLSKGGWTYV